MKLDNIDTRKLHFSIGTMRGALSKLPPEAHKPIEEALVHLQGAARYIECEQRALFKTRSKAARDKRSKKKTKRDRFPREVTIKLAQCVLTALNTRGRMGVGSGIIVLQNRKTGKLDFRRWEDDFFDALEGIGVVYDRDAYFAAADRKRKKRAVTESDPTESAKKQKRAR